MNDEIPLGSACSGYGGLEMGIGLAIPNLVTRWVADYEPPKKGKPQEQSAAKVLAHRYPDAPNLGDITIVNWPATAPVRVICAGTPCQDVSAAGARAGMRAGTRSGIWSSMVEAINHHRPTLVVWENVRGALSAEADSNVEPCPICMGDERECTLRALGRVLGDLAELGYDTVWYGLPAAAVGAPHERFRVFVAAWPANPPSSTESRQPGGGGETRPGPIGNQSPDGGYLSRGRPIEFGPHPATHPESNGRDEGWTEPEGQQRRPDAAERGDVDWGPFGAAIGRWESVLGRTAPTPTQATARGGQNLAPAFVEWMMGLPAGWVTDVPDLTRNEQLHVLGNGVVPQQAGAAVEYLLGFAPAWVRADLGLSTPSPTPVDNPGHGHVTP